MLIDNYNECTKSANLRCLHGISCRHITETVPSSFVSGYIHDNY